MSFLSKSDVFLYAEKNVEVAPAWCLLCSWAVLAVAMSWKMVIAVLGDVSALTGERLGHHTPRGGISLEKVTCDFKVLISQWETERREASERWGSSSGKFGCHRDDNLLITFKTTTFLPWRPLRFSSSWKYFVFDFRAPAQIPKAK